MRGGNRKMVSETDRKAWKALEGKHDAVSNATRQELYDELAKTKMKLGQDPDGFMYIMETARDRLHDMGEHILPIGSVTLYSTPSRRITTSCVTPSSGTVSLGY